MSSVAYPEFYYLLSVALLRIAIDLLHHDSLSSNKGLRVLSFPNRLSYGLEPLSDELGYILRWVASAFSKLYMDMRINLRAVFHAWYCIALPRYRKGGCKSTGRSLRGGGWIRSGICSQGWVDFHCPFGWVQVYVKHNNKPASRIRCQTQEEEATNRPSAHGQEWILSCTSVSQRQTVSTPSASHDRSGSRQITHD